jgi:uncharacterized protein YndB with AHSA1/START domain
MNDDAQFKTVPMVCFERRLPGPIELVWEFVTDTSRLPGWFRDGAIEPRVGGSVALMAGHVRGVVTQWHPPRRLTYAWNVFGPGEKTSRYPESYLAIELETRGSEVSLTLTHLPVLERFEKQNAMGWHTCLDMLDAAIRDQPTAARAAREAHMKRNAGRYEVDLSKLVK